MADRSYARYLACLQPVEVARPQLYGGALLECVVVTIVVPHLDATQAVRLQLRPHVA
ncbi:MAG: hypothetical protein ACREV7_21675 [Steroidobacteraceae bacterium]